MPTNWIIKRNEKESGPFTSQQLKQLASSGKLKPADLIRKETDAKLMRANSLKGLFSESEPKDDLAGAAGGDSADFANVDLSRYGDVPMEEDDDDGEAPARSKRAARAESKKSGGKGKSKSKSRKNEEFLWENDPVNDLFWGTMLVGFSIGGFFYLNWVEQNNEEYDMPGFVTFIYENTGKFGVSVFLLLLSLIFFIPAFQKIQRLSAKGKSIPWHLPALGGFVSGIFNSGSEESEE